MAKGYWLAFVTVTDPERYAGYQAHAPAAFKKYGARFVVRAGATTHLEGPEYGRHIVIEFETVEQALACYHSPEYQAARALRDGACDAVVTIVEGHEAE